MSTRPTQIRIPESIKAKAKRRARLEGTTLSAEVIAYLEAYGAGEPATVREEVAPCGSTS